MKLIPYFKKIVIDITYIHVRNEGWTYIASVMDLYDRKIIDWAYGKNITAELAVNAVRNAYIESFHSVLVHLVWWTSEVLTPFDIVVRCFTER